jgi:hypothetical protein
MWKIKVFIIIIALTSIACESEDLLEENSIDSNIQITPQESVRDSSLQLGLSCKTEKIYPCINYSILTEVNFNEDLVKVNFIRVPEINICLTAPGPATTIIDLSDISNGEYSLELNNGSLKNNGHLKITDTEIVLEFNSGNGIEIVRHSTKIIPSNTYWGTVGYHTENNIDRVNEFLDLLKAKDEVTNFNNQIPGIYSFFEINQKGEIIPSENSGYHFTKYIVFQYDGEDNESFKEEIDQLSTAFFEDMIINFQNVDGDRIYNWD